MESINIEEIMQEIRQEIKEKGYKDEDLSFNDIPIPQNVEHEEVFNEDALLYNLNMANTSVKVDYYKPIGGGIKGFLKKIVRKIIKPIILHLCQEQEQHNAEVVKTINQLYRYNKILESRIEDLEKIIVDKES